MKLTKKLLSMLIALTMVFTLAIPAFAAGEKGSITIDNAEIGQTYTIYQILKLESFSNVSSTEKDENGNPAGGNYAYKVTEAWEGFVNDADKGGKFLTVDEAGYVTWKADADVVEFAKLAQEYAKNLANNQGKKDANSATVSFENLDLGYYLVDSTLGALCSLDTTNREIIMREKNAVPEIEKEVQEDSEAGENGEGGWGTENDADIGDTVNFKATVTVQKGAENYVVHDTMSAGLTYTGVTAVKVNGKDVEAANYEVKKPGTCNNCTFEVAFDNTYIAGLEAGTEIVIEYSAVLNENAEIAGEGNPNEVELKYGEDNTVKSTTKTYTWDMEVLKYANGDETSILPGVKFVLLNEGKTKVATVEDGKITGWIDVPTEDAAWPENTTLITDAAGKIHIDGLDADKYYLKEIETLPGYNMLNVDKEVTITKNTANYTTPVTKVENKSGTELPSTGGIGTTLFYGVGGAMFLGALIMLVTKKRMKD